MEPQPALAGPLGQGRQRVDAAEVGGAGGGHQGHRELAGGLHPVKGPVQLPGAQPPVAVDPERLDGPAAQPQQGGRPGHAEVGQLRAQDPVAPGVRAEPVGGGVAAGPAGGGVAGQQQPHQVGLGAAAGHHAVGHLRVPADPGGQPGHQPTLQVGGDRPLVPGVERLVGRRDQRVGGHGGGQGLAVQVGGARRVGRVDGVAQAEAAQPVEGGVQPGALLGERVDPGRHLGQPFRAGPAVGPVPLRGGRGQAAPRRPGGRRARRGRTAAASVGMPLPRS